MPLKRRSADPFLLNKKVVGFASVQVKTYPVILGDNPAVSSGPPVTLDWEAETSSSSSIDEWEMARCIDRRRSREEIRVPPCVRTEWLLEAGFSPLQVHEAIQDIQKEQQRRRSSIVKSPLQDKADVVAEQMKRKLERVVGKRSKSGTLYKQWMLSSQ